MAYFYDASSSNGRKRHPSLCFLQVQLVNQIENIDKYRTQHSIQSKAYNKCCPRHKDIQYVFILWWRVYAKKLFPEMNK